MKNTLILALAIVFSFGGLAGCAQCACMGSSAALILQDENGEEVLADEITYLVDGKLESIPDDHLDGGSIDIVGNEVGTFHFWVTVGDQTWESDDIEIEMEGPDDCRRPKTKRIVVTFYEDDAESEIYTVGGGC